MRTAASSLALGLVVACTLSLAASAKETRVTGEALVRSMGPNRVAILIDTNGDKSIDQGFLLDSELPLAAPRVVHFDKAEVQFDDGYVRAGEKDHLYELFVAGYPEPPAAADEAKLIRFTGFGITHRQGETKYDIDKARTDDEVTMPGW